MPFSAAEIQERLAKLKKQKTEKQKMLREQIEELLKNRLSQRMITRFEMTGIKWKQSEGLKRMIDEQVKLEDNAVKILLKELEEPAEKHS